jgi:hypothetical protein
MESFGMLFWKETNTINLAILLRNNLLRAMLTNKLVNTLYQTQNNSTRGHMT